MKGLCKFFQRNMKRNRWKRKKVILNLLFIPYLAISYYCYHVQEDYLYSTVLPKDTYIKLNIYGWLIVSIIIFFFIRDKNDYSKLRTLKERLTIGIISQGLTFFASIALSGIWLPVCLVLPIKLNSICNECSVQVKVFQIDNIMVSEPKGLHISPDYTQMTICDLETNKKMQLYMSSNILSNADTHLSLTYCKGNFGWYILKSNVQFIRSKQL